ncbi:MAG TPA: DoxX family protein [Stellaceae bacterium]|nr:DoxX family protein [Stellaceae bacterium]
MSATENMTMLVGRILMSLLFITSGWSKLLAPAAVQAMFAKQNLPFVEGVWLLAVAIELGGGLAIFFGLLTRPVAFVCALWCVGTALVAHTNFADGMQKIQFFKNMGMAGGFLYIAVFGAGSWALDGWFSRRRRFFAAE